MPSKRMNCDQVKDRLRDYFERELARPEREALEGHVAGCRACRGLVQTASELTCRDLTGFLDDYEEGRLPPDRAAVFERHLTICPECRAYLDSYRKTVAATRCAFADEAAAMPDRLVRAILMAARGGA